MVRMAGWTWQAWFGLIGGSLIFFAVLGPTLLIQMRRYGTLSFRRLLGAAATSIYAVALVAYTLLPLPDAAANCGVSSAGIELIPGHSVGDILRETQGLSLLAALTSHATLQVALNVALFIPFGIIARRYWNRGPVVSIALGAALSLLIETTQLTGIWGIYDCAYRVADVDDLLTNTAGAAIGVLLAPLLLSWMPSTDALRRDRSLPRPVTVWRRWFGMVLDAVAVNVTSGLLSVSLLVPQLAVTGGKAPSTAVAIAGVAVVGVGTIALVVVLPALLTSGASIGQRLVWLAPMWPSDRASRWRRLHRASAVALPYTLAIVLDQLPGTDAGPLQTVVGLVGIVSGIIVLVAVVSVPFSRGHRGLSLILSGGELRDVRS
jgi:glycopeptide antibiotics resistance protein